MAAEQTLVGWNRPVVKDSLHPFFYHTARFNLCLKHSVVCVSLDSSFPKSPVCSHCSVGPVCFEGPNP